jgi:uncharacterized alpha-E superfamily protein
VLLSRVAEDLYWAGRYLERAEDTARIVREHTNLIVDLPTRIRLTWEPLLALTGSRDEFDARYARADEDSVIRYLLTDQEHGGSLTSSVIAARDDLRTSRQVLPRLVWEAVNDLYLFVRSHGTDGVERRSRSRFLDQVIRECHLVRGVLATAMSHDESYEMIQLGGYVERADMTTRILDTRAVALLEPGTPGVETYDNVQWTGLLRSQSALQMFHRAMRRPVDGPSVVRFLLADPAFPRSVAHCMDQTVGSLRRLPRGPEIEGAVDTVLGLALEPDGDGLDAEALRERLDRIQVGIASVHARIVAVFFAAEPAPAPAAAAAGAARPPTTDGDDA